MRVIVAGAIANKPENGGEAWVRLSWIRGLADLGADVTFIERIAGDDCTDADGRAAAFAESINVRWFDEVVGAFGLEGRAALVLDDGLTVHGSTMEQLADLTASADLLVNISGHLTTPILFDGPAVRAYIDIDPGYTQCWMADAGSSFAPPRHDLWFTIAENIGRRDCGIPGAGIDWIPVRQPVVLEDWPASRPDPVAPFTTVASWRGAFGAIEWNGHRHGLKAHEFRKLIDLPKRTRERLAIALAIHEGDRADRDRLVSGGWELWEPRAVARDPLAFRRFVTMSKAELSVAQGIYVDTRSGWFSDRTTRYLAAGRAAVVQDTGFGRSIPVGDGLLAFGTPEEALTAIERIAADPEHHSIAARQVAERYFDSRHVLARFLDIVDSRRSSNVWKVRAVAPEQGGGQTSTSAVASDRDRFDLFDPDCSGVADGARHRGNGSAAPVVASTGPAFDRRSSANRRSSPKTGPLRILVSGMMAGVPGQGGATWAVLQYVLGLLRLGHDVRFIEPVETDAGPVEKALSGSGPGAYLDQVARAFRLEGRIGLIRSGTKETHGIGYDEVAAFASDADVLLNLSGLLREPALFEPPRVRVYVDLDPAFTQLWNAEQGVDMRFDGHTHFVTVGLSIGAPTCTIPTCGLDWIPTVQPIVLEQWTPGNGIEHHALTGIANWRGYGSVEKDGVLYGQKAHSVRQLIDLPAHAPMPIAFALAIHPDEKRDISALSSNGWTLLDPSELSATPASYRRFIRGSWAELGIAKSGYVRSRCGWFSDRSICYLASGRPVVAQDTGFSRHLPVGEGILAFDDVNGAVAAIDAIRRDYGRHSRAARRAAELVFDSDDVLAGLLERVAA